MSMSADEIVDRRRLRRKLTFWRVIAVIVGVVAIIALIAGIGGGNAVRNFGPQIARVNITGFIGEDRKQLQMLDRIGKDDAVKGVIISINSGGGSTVGGEALYHAVRKLAEKKPTVAQMGTVAASAAYMTAIATDHIVARRTTITASIGVIFQYPELSQLLDKIGVKMEEIKSAPLKAEPSPFHPASEEARAVAAGVIADSYQWFVDIVAERRGLPRDTALGLADGRIMSGGQALAVKLIDEIGGEETARAWLEEKRGVPVDLPIRDWSPRNMSGFPFGDAALLWIAREIGVSPDTLRGLGFERLLPDPFNLDGLRSVWQGQSDPRDSEEAYQ
jgi:protease-4